jgi:hypothetical protein
LQAGGWPLVAGRWSLGVGALIDLGEFFAG